MKTSALLLLLIGLFFATASSQAASKWWDVNAAGSGSGQTTTGGTWNISTQNWTTDSNGLSAATTFATGDQVIFSAGTDATNAFTVNVPSAVTAGGITVEEGSVTFSGAAITIGTNIVTVNSGAKLAIPSSPTILPTLGATLILDGGTMQNNATGVNGSFVSTSMTIMLTTNNGTLIFNTPNILNIVQSATVISGPGSLTKGGVGVLAIASTCTYAGGTTVTNGELRVRTISNPLPTNTDLFVTSPGIFNLNGLSQQIASLNGDGIVGTGSGTLTINGSSNSTFFGAISNIANAGAGGATSGNGKLTKTGTGTITFAGLNNINGNVTLNNGGIVVLTNASLCGPVCDLFINGGTLSLSNAAQTVENVGGTGGTIVLGAGHTLTSIPFSSATNSSAISGSGGFTYSPPNAAYVQTLNGADTYTGATTVTAGTVAVGASGSLTGTAAISLAAGTSFDVSAAASPYNFTTNTTLIASGTGLSIGTTAATIVGASSGTVSLGSQPVVLNYNSTDPALYISQGTLALNSNPFTINTASPLAHNTYVIAEQASGNITATGTFTVAGTAIAPGDAGTIQAVGSNLVLTVDVAGNTPPQPANNTGINTLPDGTLLLTFSGSPNTNYIVQATTNLHAPAPWVKISTNTSGTNGVFQFDDLTSTNFKARFYRTSTQ